MEKQEKKETKVNDSAREIMENRKPSTILVTDFVNKYNSYKSDNAKSEYLKNMIKVKDYVSYATKMTFANQIVAQTHNIDGVSVKVDTAKQYVLFIIGAITLYMNIEFSSTPISDYDLLDKAGLLEQLIGMIPNKEYKNLKLILDMATNDFMTNNYGVVPILQKLVGVMTESFAPILDEIKNMDKDTLLSLVDKLK